MAPELAHHLHEAGAAADRHRTMKYTRFAAESAEATVAWAEASKLYARCLELIGEDETAAVRGELLMAQGRCAWALGNERQAVAESARGDRNV